MQIVIEKNKVKAARITGPEHHFLCIEFAEAIDEIVFVDCSNNENHQSKHQELLSLILQNMDNYFIHFISTISFDTQDTPNKFAYEELISCILNEAKNLPCFTIVRPQTDKP